MNGLTAWEAEEMEARSKFVGPCQHKKRGLRVEGTCTPAAIICLNCGAEIITVEEAKLFVRAAGALPPIGDTDVTIAMYKAGEKLLPKYGARAASTACDVYRAMRKALKEPSHEA